MVNKDELSKISGLDELRTWPISRGYHAIVHLPTLNVHCCMTLPLRGI